MKIQHYLYLLSLLFMLHGCGGGSSTKSTPETTISPEAVDNNVTLFFKEDTTQNSTSEEMQALIGNWYGTKDHLNIALQLRKDGTYLYHSTFFLGKYHNLPRTTDYEGVWSLEKGNSQVVLSLLDVDAPLILTNNFPYLQSPSGITLYPGTTVETKTKIQIDQDQNLVLPQYTQKAQEYMQGTIADLKVDYFTMVAPKVNSEAFWSSVDLLPMGYNYGHKLGDWTDEWDYALKRIKDDPNNYTMVISDENWQTLLGNRGIYKRVIMDATKMYRWFEYFKIQMQILGKVNGTVLYIFAGDAPASWTSDVRNNFDNDPKKVPANLYESRFPEVLERKPSNSFAGVFQMMDYLRMKYAPNVKLGYTIKTWGIPASKILFDEPQEGWENRDETKIMAEYFNNFDVEFDILAFNFNPRSKHEVDGYKSAVRYFGAVSKMMRTRNGSQTKLWIWKLSLWNQEQTSFIFKNINFLVDECNAIGVTLGHGNDLVKQSGFSDDVQKENYVQSWIKEYYSGNEQNISIHGTLGKVFWR